MVQESRYAKRLRELGFEPMSPEQQAYVDRRIERRLEQQGIDVNNLTRNERRRIKKLRCQPAFTVFTGAVEKTFVVDELGMHWTTLKAIDASVLTAMGFKNDIAWLPAALALPPLKPDKTH